MNALNAASKRLLDCVFGSASEAWLVRGKYDANDELVIIEEGPAGSFSLPDDEDLYYCVSTVDGGRTKVKRVYALVIDDVGKEINKGAFELFFPLVPTDWVESSTGSFQVVLAIDGGMDVDEYKALRQAMRGNPTWGGAHNKGAAAIFRVPQGAHTKSTHGGWKVRDDNWTGIKHRPEDIWKALAAGAPKALGKGSKFDLVATEALLDDLLALIPNQKRDWELFVNVGRAVWGASEGQWPDPFHKWAAKFGGSDAAITQARWDSYHDAVIGRFWLLRLAKAADPAGAEAWLRKEAAAEFDDGMTHPGQSLAGLPKALQLMYAREIARRHGAAMRWVLERRSWAMFDGQLWRHLSPGIKLAGQHAMAMAMRAPPKDKGEHDVTTLSFLDGVEGLCRQMPELQAHEADFDRDPMLLGTPSGTVDLKTGALRAADARDMIAKAARVAPGGDCKRWKRFLVEVTKGDLESIAYLQQYAGYCLTGLTIEEVFLFLYGPGGNGKSKFVDTLAWLWGDYAVKPVADLFLRKAQRGHTSVLAMLAGARLATASEVPANAQWDEAFLKDVTGGGAITAGFKHRDEFTFVPCFKLFAYGNSQPTFPGGIDKAIRRRFRMMEFLFEPKVPDTGLFEELKKEGPGILQWAIEGCLAWQKTSLMTPKKVTDATDALFEGQDLVAQWLDARVEKSRGSFIGATDFFNDWLEFRNGQGEHELLNNATTFGLEMVRRGLLKGRTKAVKGYLDVKFKSKAKTAFDDE